MAKNVIITEDGNSKTISNATRIRTALEGGGTCDWIPKDDVPLQELTVTEDGVYDPEEGYYGFSQVTASGVGTVVEGTLIEKTVIKNGTYNITDESGNPYGYSKITVNVDTSDDDSGGGSGGSNPVVGKDEDGNDTMAETDDDGNIVMTALPTEIKVIIPPTKLEYNRYEEVDYSGISVYAYISKAIHWLGTTTTAVSEGSSNDTVSIGGNSITASVGDGVLYAPDRTWQNDVQLVWDGTKWIKPSNYSAEKAIWKSDKYPTGKIPFEELIFAVKRINSFGDASIYERSFFTSAYGDVAVSNSARLVIEISENTDTIIARGIITIECSCNEGFFLTHSYNNSYNVSILYFTSNQDSQVQIKAEGNVVVQRISYSGNRKTIIDREYNGIKSGVHSYYGVRYRDDAGLYNINNNIICKETRRTWANWKQYPDSYSEVSNDYETTVIDVGNHNYIHNISLAGTYFGSTGSTGFQGGFYFGYYTYYDEISSVGLEPGVLTSPLVANISSAISAGIEVLQSNNNYISKMAISLPVQWKRPGDGKNLETTFTAWMKDDGGDNNGGDD